MRLLDVVSAPWAITPEMFGEVQSIYSRHCRGDKIDLKAVEARIGQPLNNARKDPEIRDGVAVLSVEGVLAKRANLLMQVSGGTSMQVLAGQFRAALDDPAIRGIVLDVDSPGGTVDGTQELRDAIFAARGRKPVVAVGTGAMLSAAYWIGSAADRVYISSETVSAGSIGVVATHVDVSKAEEQAGVKTTEIVAGKYKRIASQFSPLTEAGREDIQAKVDYLYSVFVNDVAENRGVSAEQVLELMADGKVFLGPQAIRAGLVDGMATVDSVVADMTAGRITAARPSRTTGAAGRGPDTQEQDMELTVDKVKSDFPAIAEALREEGRAEGATAERERIRAVEDACLPGHEALISTLKYDGKTSGGEAALAVNKAERVKRGDKLTQLRADAADAGKVPTAQPKDDDGVDKNAPLEERAKATWDKSPALRAEFADNFKDYLAFAKAQEGGHVRILAPKARAA